MEETSLEAVHFNDEIQGLMAPPPETANSFTALLELPPTQAVEILHSPEAPGKPPRHGPKPYPLTSFSATSANLTFPSNAALIERAARFSAFAGENSNSNTNTTSNSPEVKRELPESDSTPSSTYCRVSDLASEDKNPKSKEREKKVKASSKKRKSVADESSGDGEKLPYVHVRVRRGQATDSHSLAERARREKINARMKLLQELVPGCNKISGMTLVLDKIINHVQSLQQEVEILSMKLAAVNPVIDFNLDCLMATEGVSPMECNFPPAVAPIIWPEIPQNGNRPQYLQPEIPQNGNRQQYQQPEIHQNGNRQQYQQPEIHQNGNRQQYQQLWQFDAFHQPLLGREEDNSNFMTPENSLLSYDSSANSVSLHLSELKMEL